MVRQSIFFKTGTTLALFLLSGFASADVNGVLKMCSNCHGEDGRGTDADTPIIAGIPAVVQEDALYAYIDGDRNCGSKPMMCKAAQRLTEDQVVELAEHFAALPYVPAGEEFDPALAETGKGIVNYVIVLGIIETVALFVMAFCKNAIT